MDPRPAPYQGAAIPLSHNGNEGTIINLIINVCVRLPRKTRENIYDCKKNYLFDKNIRKIIINPRYGVSMKKEMSSFDVRSIAQEMASLEGGHMDKIFQWDSGTVLFRINISGEGKRDLFFKNGKWLYLPATKPETPITPLSFATYLRKYTDNARIGKTYQVGFDRVLIMEVLKADFEYKLVFELFGGGNILLVNNGVIENCLIHKTMRDRIVRPGEQYVMPKERFDPTSSPYEQFSGILKSSSSDVVRTLATGTSLGGQYAEEVCKLAGISKNTPVSELTDNAIAKLWDCMKDLVDRILQKPTPIMYRNGDGEIVDITPTNLSIYEEFGTEEFQTLSLAVGKLMEEISEAEERNYVDPELEKLQRRIDKQTETIEEYQRDSESLRAKADAVYAYYGQINELLEVLKVQSARLTWDKLKEGASKIPFVASIDPRKNSVTVKFDDITIPLDYTKGIDANASNIYAQGKEISDKAVRANEALKASQEAYDKRLKGITKAQIARASRAQPTKQFWFERYKWFITTGGRLVLAGKDAHTNDNVVRKHLKDTDVYAHADLHGAPSTIVKDGQKADDQDLREACNFALAQSKGWVAALTDGSSYWVYPDQVSKTPEAGEFVPRGAFIIRGKRNYEHHLKLELAVGEITYQKERKVMCGPIDAVKTHSEKYFVIVPGRGKAGKTAALMAKELNVPEEEISRILPPGDCEIKLKVWPKDPSQENEESDNQQSQN